MYSYSVAEKLESRAQKVRWKTLEREELLCIRDSVVHNPIQVHENRLVMWPEKGRRAPHISKEQLPQQVWYTI